MSEAVSRRRGKGVKNNSAVSGCTAKNEFLGGLPTERRRSHEAGQQTADCPRRTARRSSQHGTRRRDTAEENESENGFIVGKSFAATKVADKTQPTVERSSAHRY